VIDLSVGLRVTHQAEIEGLDMNQHDEEGYIFI
jgi:ammonia channel protein AmtB